MKSFGGLIVTGSLAAFASSGTLPSDAHYVVVPAGYASPEA
jgi:hypothetical protein